MKRKECLETAIEIVCKAREDAYGNPEEDNYIDLCGYGACACELGHKEVKADELWSKEKWIQGKRHI